MVLLGWGGSGWNEEAGIRWIVVEDGTRWEVGVGNEGGDGS